MSRLRRLGPRGWTTLVVAAALGSHITGLGNGLLVGDLDQETTGALSILFGPRPVLFHLTSLLLHGVTSWLLLSVARSVATPLTAGVAALLFAVWPSGSEAVYALAWQGVVLSTCGLLLALWWTTIQRHTLWQAAGVALAGGAALAVSPQALSLPLLLLLLHRRQRRLHAGSVQDQDRAPHLVTQLVVYGLMLAWLLWHLPRLNGVLALLDPLRNPLILQPLIPRIMLAMDGVWSSARLSLLPTHLAADYGMGVTPTDASLGTGLWAGALLALLLVAVVRYHRRGDLLSMGLLWWAACLLPVSNVVVPVSHAMTEAYLYLPVAGLCMSLAAALSAIGPAVTGPEATDPEVIHAATAGSAAEGSVPWRSALALPLACLMAVFVGSRTMIRGADWQSEESVWQATIRAQPSSARAHEALATALQARGALAMAEQHYLRAIAIYPRFVTAHYNLGLTHYEQARWTEALARFERTCQLQPHHAGGHLNRGATLYRLERWMEAADAYRQAAELRPAWPVPWLNLADALRAAGDEQAAAAAAAQARALGAVSPFQ